MLSDFLKTRALVKRDKQNEQRELAQPIASPVAHEAGRELTLDEMKANRTNIERRLNQHLSNLDPRRDRVESLNYSMRLQRQIREFDKQIEQAEKQQTDKDNQKQAAAHEYEKSPTYERELSRYERSLTAEREERDKQLNQNQRRSRGRGGYSR